MRLSLSLFALVLTCLSAVSQAADPEQTVRQALTAIQPGLVVESIAESPLTGIYQVEMQGGRQLYVSADGKFLLQGYLYRLQGDQAVNLTEQAESRAVAKQINSVPLEQMVVFSPKSPKTHITVFTDTDCGYCQKLHNEVPELNRQGIEVRYLAFPRQGLDSAVGKELVSVWCAKDRQAAMNRAKARKPVAPVSCDNPIAKQYKLGQMIGINGTPAIVLADGTIIPGYQPVSRLAPAALQAK